VGYRRPPRIDGFDYLGPYAYFLTICTFSRKPWFVNRDDVNAAMSHLLRTGKAYGFAIVAYCFMPDHLHALVEGARVDSDFVRWTAMFKQQSAFAHLIKRRRRLWQPGYFEHVIRREEDYLGIAAYIVANPIRAGLCHELVDYPYLGSDRYTLDELREAIQVLPSWK